MEWLKSLYEYIQTVEQKRVYQYIAGILITLSVLVLVVLYVRSSYRDSALTRLADINEQREQVKRIITNAQKIKQQRAQVNAMLAKDDSFKITSYLDTVLKKLHLSEKTTIGEHSQVDRENGYRESTRKITLVNMNMKELSELLHELEQNERIYIKDLEIVRSSRTPQTIDVMLSVATLEPRTTVSS